ncbi:hypothetical protein VDGL01_10485 [Verticillium dahliae]
MHFTFLIILADDDFDGHRAQELLRELQECLSHRPILLPVGDDENPKPSDILPVGDNENPKPSDITGTVADDIPVRTNGKARPHYQCPHDHCKDKEKTNFTRRKDLVRHYTIHVACRELCLFCDCPIHVVRAYVTHFDACEVRRRQAELGTVSREHIAEAVQKRRSLNQAASSELEELLTRTHADKGTGKRSSTDSDLSGPNKRWRHDDNGARNHRPPGSCEWIPLPGVSSLHTAATPSSNRRLDDSTAGQAPVGSEAQAHTTNAPATASHPLLKPLAAYEVNLQSFGILPRVEETDWRSGDRADLEFQGDHVNNQLPEALPRRAPVVSSYTMDVPYDVTFDYHPVDTTAGHSGLYMGQQSFPNEGFHSSAI